MRCLHDVTIYALQHAHRIFSVFGKSVTAFDTDIMIALYGHATESIPIQYRPTLTYKIQFVASESSSARKLTAHIVRPDGRCAALDPKFFDEFGILKLGHRR